MIKANELRIGNLFILDNKEFRPSETGKIHKIIDIRPDFAGICINKQYYQEYGQFYNYLQPIPLTEEILLKVGFVSDELNGSFETFENGLKFTIIDKCGAWMIYLSGPFGMIVLKHIKFVHELQNLFNSLTGQELNIAGLI